MLTAAAVIGREFRLQVLEAVVDHWERHLAISAHLAGEGQSEGSVNTLSVLDLLDEALAAHLLFPYLRIWGATASPTP